MILIGYDSSELVTTLCLKFNRPERLPISKWGSYTQNLRQIWPMRPRGTGRVAALRGGFRDPPVAEASAWLYASNNHDFILEGQSEG